MTFDTILKFRKAIIFRVAGLITKLPKIQARCAQVGMLSSGVGSLRPRLFVSK
jgi:hypothetical protein